MLVSSFVGVVLIENVSATRNILYVGGSGPGNYTTIQSAIDAANPGDTVFVYNGIYYENVVLNKNYITLTGENKETTTIIADESAMAAIYVDTFHSTKISGFALHCPLMPGVYFRDSYDNIIFDCIMSDCPNGAVIYTEYIGMNNTVMDCDIYNNTCGVLITGAANNYHLSQSKILNCSIYNNENQGILIIGRSDWSGTIDDSIISGCDIFHNTGNGIVINQLKGEIQRVVIDSNNIQNNSNSGIQIRNASNITIKDCNVIQNTIVGINLSSTSNLTVFHNNIVNNPRNAYDNGTNTWNDSYPSGGNYWSDYTGVDNYHGPNQNIPGSDGIGDTPYDLPCEHAMDWYPLMYPFEMYTILKIVLPNIPIYEDDVFPVIIRSLAELPIPDAIVTFNDETLTTDSNGTVWLTAPQVEADTLYEITANKPGYTGANETILIKNVLQELTRAFIFGKITNLSSQGEYIQFEAVKTRVIVFSPFSFNTYVSGEKFAISKEHQGFIGVHYIFALCKILI